MSLRFQPPYRIRFQSRAGSVDDFVVHDRNGIALRLRLRTEATPDERCHFMGTEDEWQRETVAAVGILHIVGQPDQPVPDDLLAAFNGWVAEQHARAVSRMVANPELYGDRAHDDPLFVPPAPAVAGYHAEGIGWVRLGEEPELAAPAAEDLDEAPRACAP